ncbi:hypothetical protein SLEP1_g13968 [Rubroshorea leprosula]|uniref:Glycerol-3-phosphate acyltransferase RAM2/GPAT1-8 HAD-like domain-containing protein n=1 Tax=Rubroshorea leprosula TaxID=152421 RepID=A0AAV5IQI7_9ROSI|nr:hypothetical protein SLEP1_g13968 [Rubroshorea leprosula]
MSLAEQDLNPNKSSVFHMEGVLLKSCSVFPYFMLVAFEAGGPLRAFVLLLLYPLLCLVGRKIGMKIMVFVSFVGLKEETFRIGSTVLPKFFLEDIGNEGFDMVMKYSGRKIGVSEMPRVMVERFLRDYLRVEGVVGKELKVISGHFTGLMEEKNTGLGDVFSSSDIGLCCFKNQKLFSLCEVVYLVNEETCQMGGRSKFEVANHVQGEIAKALGFKCTNLTRKDKYKLLAGNEGLIKRSVRKCQ